MPEENADFNQSDLDNLFNEVLGSGQKKEPEAQKPQPAPAGEPGAAKQEESEIDKLLESAGASEAAGGNDVSQAEIDSLLGGLVGGGATQEVNEADLSKYELKQFDKGPGSEEGATGDIYLLRDVSLNVKIELGRAKMYIKDVLKLAEGSVVELDKLAGDPLDILVNNRLIAKGEVLVLNDNFCVRITEILSPQDRKDQEK